MSDKRRTTITVLATATVLVLLVGGTATAAKLITGKDIKDNSITGKDIKDNSITGKDVKGNSLSGGDVKDDSLGSGDIKDKSLTGSDVKDGSLAAGDLSAAARASLTTTYAGENWGIVDRNVIGAADAYLRAGPAQGPAVPPYGIGSLGIHTASGADKTAFGNQVDFLGDDLASITALGYSVFTTAENNALAPNNMPSIAIEINPNLTAPNPTTPFSTLVYAPDDGTAGQWTTFDAITDPTPHWGLTGGAFAGTTCDINGARCTWDEVMAYLNDGDPAASMITVQISKGRDFAFSGAVDGLQINDDVYDFEPFGVSTTTAP